MQISIIAAVALNGVIGCRGSLPWHLPSDLLRFRHLTIGKTVIMGRKTWESLPVKPLPRRINIVVTRTACGSDHFFVHPAGSLDDAITMARGARSSEVFVIGGGEIYREALPLADRILLTCVNLEPEGDVTFPEMTGFRSALIGDWQIENGIQFRFETYTKEAVVNVQTAK